METQTTNQPSIPITIAENHSVKPAIETIIEDRQTDHGKSLPTNQLLDALYFIWDAAERGQLNVFLIGNTAIDVISQSDLSGDKITVGVRRNEWDSGQGRITKTFLEHELGQKPEAIDDIVTYTTRSGVPIEIKLFDDDIMFSSFDIIYYKYETFNLPNPYKEFVKKYE